MATNQALNNPDNIVSVQVLPWKSVDGTYDVLAQPEGPTAETEGWAVYLRKPSGEAMWVADVEDEPNAEFIGSSYAKHLGVDIEPQPWKQQ
jgi:hypothetical protein